MDLSFWKDKRVFLTGHTGFKGSWMCRILIGLGAEVYGYALKPTDKLNLFDLSGVKGEMESTWGDIRDLPALHKAFAKIRPEIVIHMAAQPLVRESYQNPAYTYDTNVMGTVNILECVRESDEVRSVVNVTTDKVYQNKEWEWGYRESDPLNGFDPYSNSKSCSELVTHSYRDSFLSARGIAVSTARAGNVIGGGDFSADRIIPDCIRAAGEARDILVRNPDSVRPYQHVLEPLFAYLLIAQRQVQDSTLADSYNVGPDDADCLNTSALVSLFCDSWGQGQTWRSVDNNGPHEASFLKLDCSRIKSRLGWKPTWGIETAIEKTIEWDRAYRSISHKRRYA